MSLLLLLQPVHLRNLLRLRLKDAPPDSSVGNLLRLRLRLMQTRASHGSMSWLQDLMMGTGMALRPSAEKTPLTPNFVGT